MATNRDVVHLLLEQNNVVATASALDLITYHTAIPHTLMGHCLHACIGTGNGRMDVFKDNLEALPSYTAMVENGQTSCFHCMCQRGSFGKREGRTPFLVYARPCQVHSLEHPTSYSISQWMLDKANIGKTFIHNPLGGLAVIWVDPDLVGQITVQLLKQDPKADRSAVVDAYAFSNKISNIGETYGYDKSQVVRDHVIAAMMLKYEGSALTPKVEVPLADVATDMPSEDGRDETPSPPGERMNVRHAVLDLPRADAIIAAYDAIGGVPHGICFVMQERRTLHPILASTLRRTDSTFVDEDMCLPPRTDVGGVSSANEDTYINEGFHNTDEDERTHVSSEFHDISSDTHDGSAEGFESYPMQTGSDFLNGYVLEHPPGLTAEGVIGDPRAVNIKGEASVRGGKVIVKDRTCSNKMRNKQGHELRIHREMVHMEADLSVGEVSKPQFHDIGPRASVDGKLRGVEVAASCSPRL